MSTNIHFEHWQDTEVNTRANADLLQAGVVGASFEWGWMDDDASDLHYVNRLVNASTGAVTYKDIIFKDIIANDDIYCGEYFYHLGDTDTGRRYQIDRITDFAGGVNFVDMVEGGSDYFEINPDEVDVDTIINGTSPNLLVCKADNNRVGINESAPDEPFHITGVTTSGTDYSNKQIKAQQGINTTDVIYSKLAMYDGGGAYGADIGLVFENPGYDLALSVNDDASGNPVRVITLQGKTGGVGINQSNPDNVRLESLDASNPQIRFTHTDDTHYCDGQTDSSGNFTLTPSGDQLIFKNINDSTNAAELHLLHTTASPANGDAVGIISFRMNDDAAAEQSFFTMTVNALDVSGGSSAGQMTFSLHTGGASTDWMRFNSSGVSIKNSLLPLITDGGSVGSPSLKWSDFYLADGGVIYFGNDQEIKLSHEADIGLILEHIINTATGVGFKFLHTTTSPADNDVIGYINFLMDNDAASLTNYCNMTVAALNVGAGAMEGQISYSIMTGGASTTWVRINSSGFTTKGSVLPLIADGGAIGGPNNEWSDFYLADGGITYMGNDQDVQMAHVADKGVSINDKGMFTIEGGFAIKLINRSGGVVNKGQLVEVDTANNDSFNLTGTTDYHCIGVVYDATIADNAAGWIVVSGIADVAMEDNTAATRGYWVKTSDTEAGYADATTALPPGGGIAQLDEHSREIGHCIENVAAGGGGTHILARCVIHFN